MTEQDWKDLGRRAVACKGWRWMPGMLCIPIGGGFPVRYHGIVARDMPSAGGVQYRPDLRDPATLGCVLALVREALGKPHGHLVYDDYHWSTARWALWHFGGWSHEPTEAAALVAALEAAP